jgi:hypothetical protein
VATFPERGKLVTDPVFQQSRPLLCLDSRGCVYYVAMTEGKNLFISFLPMISAKNSNNNAMRQLGSECDSIEYNLSFLSNNNGTRIDFAVAQDFVYILIDHPESKIAMLHARNWQPGRELVVDDDEFFTYDVTGPYFGTVDQRSIYFNVGGLFGCDMFCLKVLKNEEEREAIHKRNKQMNSRYEAGDNAGLFYDCTPSIAFSDRIKKCVCLTRIYLVTYVDKRMTFYFPKS